MQKSIIAAAAAVLVASSAGFAATTLVNQTFETATNGANPFNGTAFDFDSNLSDTTSVYATPRGNAIPATTGITSISNPAFGPATGVMGSQDNVEIISPTAAFNGFDTVSVDINSRGLNAPFTLTAAEPRVTISFDYAIDNEGGAPHGPRSPIIAISNSGGLTSYSVAPTTVTPPVLSTAAADARSSFSASYNLGAGSYTFQIASDSSLDARGVQLDNILVTSSAVPEPASLGLLGLGGLALLRRRRA